MLLDCFISSKACAVLNEWDHGQTEGAHYFPFPQVTAASRDCRSPRTRGKAGEGFSHDNKVIAQSDLSAATTTPSGSWKSVISACRKDLNSQSSQRGETLSTDAASTCVEADFAA